MSHRSMILSAFFFNPQGMRAVLNEADGHPLILLAWLPPANLTSKFTQ